MNDEIKVGDVCVIVGGPCGCAECKTVIGRECTVLELEGPRLVLLAPNVATIIRGFVVEIQGEGSKRWAYARQHLRKKKPPADDELLELGDQNPNQRADWSQVPGFVPPSRVKEPA